MFVISYTLHFHLSTFMSRCGATQQKQIQTMLNLNTCAFVITLNVEFTTFIKVIKQHIISQILNVFVITVFIFLRFPLQHKVVM